MSAPRREAGVSRGGDEGGRLLVLGRCETGLGLARSLDESFDVTFFSDEPAIVDRATVRDLDARAVDVTDGGALRRLSVDPDVAVVAMPLDRTTLLVSQLLRLALPDANVVARIDNPENDTAFDGMAVEVVCTTPVLSASIRDVIRGDG